MAIQTVTLLASASYANLARTSPWVDVPANLLSLTVRMVSTAFTSAALISALKIEETYDGGVTVREIGGYTPTKGGPPDRFGQPIQPGAHVTFTNQQRAAAKIRITVVESGTWVHSFVADLET